MKQVSNKPRTFILNGKETEFADFWNSRNVLVENKKCNDNFKFFLCFTTYFIKRIFFIERCMHACMHAIVLKIYKRKMINLSFTSSAKPFEAFDAPFTIPSVNLHLWFFSFDVYFFCCWTVWLDNDQIYNPDTPCKGSRFAGCIIQWLSQ
jgi:hypothetical protein